MCHLISTFYAKNECKESALNNGVHLCITQHILLNDMFCYRELNIMLANSCLFTLPADTEQQYHPIGVFLSPDQFKAHINSGCSSGLIFTSS